MEGIAIIYCEYIILIPILKKYNVESGRIGKEDDAKQQAGNAVV